MVRRLRAVAAVLRAPSRLDREEGAPLDHRRLVVHAVGPGGGEDEVEERGLVDLGDLGAAVVFLLLGGLGEEGKKKATVRSR